MQAAQWSKQHGAAWPAVVTSLQVNGIVPHWRGLEQRAVLHLHHYELLTSGKLIHFHY
jgi:hypothetical protein